MAVERGAAQRRPAVFFGRVNARAGFQKRRRDLRVAVARGTVQRRPAVLVGRVDTRAGLQQRRRDTRVALRRGVVQRRPAVLVVAQRCAAAAASFAS